MTIIGTFTKQDDGFNGTIRTLTLDLLVSFASTTVETEKAPDYRIFAGTLEIGAAWKKTSKANRPYLSVKLDDPSFATSVNARLIEGNDGVFQLIWSRKTTA